MEWLALSIFASTALYLVDKNHAWPGFRRFGKWAGALLLLVALIYAGFSAYQQHRAKAAQIDFSQYEHIH